MNTEQQIEQVRKRLETYLTGTIHVETYRKDVGLLLSIIESQEAERERLLNLVRYCRHELLEKDLITRHEFASLLEEGSAAHLETYDQLRAQVKLAAEQMRSACVEKVRGLAAAHRQPAQGLTDNLMAELQRLRADECDAVESALESLTLQEQE